VAVSTDGAVAGYYTFAAASLPVTELDAAEIRRLPRYPVLPAGLIGRLAVSMACRKQGLGVALIVDAIQRSTRAEAAICALLVDAKDEDAARFYRHIGFRAFVSRPMTLFLSVAEVGRKLGMVG